MVKAGNNSGNSEEVKGAKGKKGKKNKESNTNKSLDSITCNICKTIFTDEESKILCVVTDVNYSSVHHVQMLLMQATSFYQAKGQRI